MKFLSEVVHVSSLSLLVQSISYYVLLDLVESTSMTILLMNIPHAERLLFATMTNCNYLIYIIQKRQYPLMVKPIQLHVITKLSVLWIHTPQR